MRIFSQTINYLSTLQNNRYIGAAGVLGTIIGFTLSGFDLTDRFLGPPKPQPAHVSPEHIEEAAEKAAEKAAESTRNSIRNLSRTTTEPASIIKNKHPLEVFPNLTNIEDLVNYEFKLRDFLAKPTAVSFGWEIDCPEDPLRALTSQAHESNEIQYLEQIVAFCNSPLAKRLIEKYPINPETPIIFFLDPLNKNKTVSLQTTSDKKKLLPNPMYPKPNLYGDMQIGFNLNDLSELIEQNSGDRPSVPEQIKKRDSRL